MNILLLYCKIFPDIVWINITRFSTGTLSRLTGNMIFEKAAMRAMDALFAHRSTIGLLGNHVVRPPMTSLFGSLNVFPLILWILSKYCNINSAFFYIFAFLSGCSNRKVDSYWCRHWCWSGLILWVPCQRFHSSSKARVDAHVQGEPRSHRTVPEPWWLALLGNHEAGNSYHAGIPIPWSILAGYLESDGRQHRRPQVHTQLSPGKS